MSPKLPSINSSDIIRILNRKGFILERQSGSHAIFINSLGKRTTVPIHGKRDLGKGLLRQIMKDADITIKDLLNK
jgi:predicted RNA binding protein YcfA (HicA-like mRNA interferase family)